MTGSLIKLPWEWVKLVFGPQRFAGEAQACDLEVSQRAICVVAAISSLALLGVSVAQAGGRQSMQWAQPLFWVSFCVIFAGPTLRGIAPRTSRTERIWMIVIASVMAFLVKQIYSPTSFAHFDEYLHWVTLTSILETGRTFDENSLLPISAYYPGLELNTAALKLLSGTRDFAAAFVIILVARLLTVLLLFRLVERVTASSRVASVAAFAFMGNSAFVFFDQQFAYESLAFPLFCGCLFLICGFRVREFASRSHLLTLYLVIVIFGLSFTHHLTSYISACYVTAILLCDHVLGRRDQWAPPLVVMVAAIAFPVLWGRLSGASTGTYLTPNFLLAFGDVFHLLSGASRLRGLFASEAGPETPLALKLGSIFGTAFISIGLATGFFRAIQRGLGSKLTFNLLVLQKRIQRSGIVSSALVVLAASALLFPVSVGLRLTPNGWEIGNRLGPFIFVGVAIVIGIAVRYFWQMRPSIFVTGSLAAAIVTIIFSGMVSGWGVDALRGPYQISADAPSIERMGIAASRWTTAGLGPGNRFASDRVNQILLGGYGKQISLTSIRNDVEVSRLFLSDTWSPEEIGIISGAQVDYVLVDLRLTVGRPKFGYFDNGPENPSTELPAKSLLKFNTVSGVSRVYDNGYIIIYDVRSINGRTR